MGKGCTVATSAACCATGSVSIPGFTYKGTGASTWTVSTGFWRNDDQVRSRDTSYFFQDFWLNTGPVQNLSSSDLPYSGWAIELLVKEEKYPLITNKSPGNQSCDGALSLSCQGLITKWASEDCSKISKAINKNIAESSCGHTIGQATYAFGKLPAHQLRL
jgi:hypothetical protein